MIFLTFIGLLKPADASFGGRGVARVVGHGGGLGTGR